MSKEDKGIGKKKDTGKREIKQVFITDDGKEEKEVSKAVKKEPHEEKKNITRLKLIMRSIMKFIMKLTMKLNTKTCIKREGWSGSSLWRS